MFLKVATNETTCTMKGLENYNKNYIDFKRCPRINCFNARQMFQLLKFDKYLPQNQNHNL